ncbi:MAG: RloB domain-containing protein [Bacteroidetes bacterium]|jgi:hypothetical protein|nr:RloB domain-containing protein [Bacteroidota bacterium]MBT6685741.1 RloB domain-containing protein [Bacteroidota bacterium]MBT7143037.1 RloB domain-containing protein [Bacteroidota bacterium]MBT7492446.1 RloB domain-containing protein [Bacteroidota bacterium]
MPKKTKAIKFGDKKQNKAWLKKVKPSEYKVETVEPYSTILIVCEGQNTEKLYFESFPVLSLCVKAVGLGQSKIQLIESTENILKSETYDEVWCVFDMDIKLDEKNCKSNFDNAIIKAKNNGYKAAYSNDSFELWFYLHYQYTEQKNHRTFYYKQLSKFWEINYEKHGKEWKFSKNIYDILMNDPKSSQKKAIERAVKLFQDKNRLEYHKQNPVTLVFELVKLLNKNMRA